MGVNSAPEKYHNIISQILHDLPGVVSMYDDVCVFGKSESEHDANLMKVMDRLRERNLTLNKTKCKFRLQEIQFMGHIISKKGIQPTDEHVKAIKQAEQPKNVSEVRSFLGLVNYSARYIHDLATIAEPLRKLTRQKNCPFVWGKEQEQSFSQLKSCLASDTVLGHFSLKAEKTTLIVDASNVGLCGVLTQTQNGQERVISYAARTLSPVEKRYSTTEKEGLSLVWACEKFRLFLLGIEFEILVDHKALEYIYSSKSKPCARIERWVLRLMPFNFRVKAVTGKSNIADALSRLVKQDKATEKYSPTEHYVSFVATTAVPCGLSLDEIGKETLNDETLMTLKVAVESGVWGEECKVYMPIKDELMVYQNVLLRGHRIIIPQNLKLRCLQLAHDGHMGIVATKQRLRTKVWWNKIDKDVENFVKRCHDCQLVQSYPNPEPMEPTPLPSRPWEVVSMDFLGPIEGEGYVLVVIDLYSRYYELAITKKRDTKTVIETLQHIFFRHGYPDTLMSDNALEFVSVDLKNFLKSCNIKQRLVTPLHPAANGEVERQNRSLLKRMRIAKASGKDWKTEIYNYVFAYRNTPHSVTGVSPAELFYGRKLKTKLPDLSLMCENGVDSGKAKERDMWYKAKSKEYADAKRHAAVRDLSTGDRVLLRQSRQTKLDTPFETTPYRLIKKTGNSCVVESEAEPGKVYKRNSTHVARYFEPVDNHDHLVSEEVDNWEHGVANEKNQAVPHAQIDDERHDVSDVGEMTGVNVRASTRRKITPLKFHDEFHY